MLTITPYSGVPPTLVFTCPDTVVATCAVATAGINPSRTSPIVRMERTNQRLSVIPFLLQLRFSGPTTGLRERGDGLPARGRRDQPVLRHQRDFAPIRRVSQGGRVLTSRALKREVYRAYRRAHAPSLRHTRLDRRHLYLPAHCPRGGRPDHRIRTGLRRSLAIVQWTSLSLPERHTHRDRMESPTGGGARFDTRGDPGRLRVAAKGTRDGGRGTGAGCVRRGCVTRRSGAARRGDGEDWADTGYGDSAPRDRDVTPCRTDHRRAA